MLGRVGPESGLSALKFAGDVIQNRWRNDSD